MKSLVDIVPSEGSTHKSTRLPALPDIPLYAAASTPMPAPCSPTGDAWDPSSRTPQGPGGQENPDQPTSTWLTDPKMRGLRILITERGQANKLYEIRNIISEVVNVRDGMAFKQLPLREVVPCTPCRREDIVVAFEPGEYFGQIFRIKEFGTEQCVLRKYGVRSTTLIEKVYHISTAKLCVIYPPSGRK